MYPVTAIVAAASQDKNSMGLPSQGLIGIVVGLVLLVVIIVVVCVAMYYRRRYRNLKAAVQEPSVEYSSAVGYDQSNSECHTNLISVY